MTSCSDVARPALIAAFITAAGPAVGACHPATPIPAGDVLATLTVSPLAPLKAFDPGSLRGAPAVVLFLSPTCVHCLNELPSAQAVAAAEHAGIVAVFVAGNRASDHAFVQQANFAGPALVDDGSLRVKYAVDHVPYALVLDAAGRATDAYIGERDADDLRAAISRARQ